MDYTAPTVPNGLAATATSTTSVTLTWLAATDNIGVTGYDVLRDGTPLATVGTVTSYTDPTVLAGEPHTYALRARDLAGNVSATSAPVSVTRHLHRSTRT